MCSPWSKPNSALLPLALLALVLAGCATAPAPLAPGAAAAWLGGTPRVIVRIDTAQVTAWREVTRTKEALKSVANRTKVVWMGFELANLDDLKTAADTVHVVLEGDFPKGAASLMLDFNSSWKKGDLKGVWTNQQMALSVSLPDDNLVTVRRNDASLAGPVAGVLRDLDPLAMQGAAAWISFWAPGEALFGATGAKLFPVVRLDVVLAANGEALEGPVVLHFADARSAQVASVVLKLLTPQIKSRFGQELEWTVEDNRVVGRLFRIQEKDLQSLAEKLVAYPPEVTP